MISNNCDNLKIVFITKKRTVRATIQRSEAKIRKHKQKKPRISFKEDEKRKKKGKKIKSNDEFWKKNDHYVIRISTTEDTKAFHSPSMQTCSTGAYRNQTVESLIREGPNARK